MNQLILNILWRKHIMILASWINTSTQTHTWYTQYSITLTLPYTGNRARISNNIDCFMWDVITHPRHNFNGGLAKPPLKLWLGWVIVSHMLCADEFAYPCPNVTCFVKCLCWGIILQLYLRLNLNGAIVCICIYTYQLLGQSYMCNVRYEEGLSLRWRHNERDCVSNHQPQYCLLKLFIGRRSKKTPKLRVTGLREGNSPETDEFPAKRASNAGNVSIWWRHHDV